MGKLLRFFTVTKEVLTTAGTVLAAAIVVVETYHEIKKKINTPSRP